jgi:lantibiotic leader peptide-processing serine protease
MFRYHRLLLAVLLAGVALGALAGSASGYAVGGDYAVQTQRYVITLSGDYAVVDGYAVGASYAVTSNYAVYAVTHQYAVYAVQAAGGTITDDLSTQIGVIIAQSPNADFATLVQKYAVVDGYAVIDAVSKDKSVPEEQRPAGEPRKDGGKKALPGQPDPMENEQWGMKMIRAPQAHGRFGGSRAVDVGILDSGIDSTHVDFTDNGTLAGPTNVDCSRAHVSVPESPAASAVAPGTCVDTGFHGTHVAGIVAAQANGVGVVGVAPNVTLVPVTVCDGYACWWSAAIDGITYAGDAKLDVINMSFYADDVETTTGPLTDCDSADSATVSAINRAIAYARSRGVTPVAALGNSSEDLASPQYADCKVVPAESPGVVGVSALGPTSGLASYSNFGLGSADVGAPGGDGADGDSTAAILSTIPGQDWFAFNGTSMASPHATGVAALIVSRYGKPGSDGDVEMKPDQVQARLQNTSTDIGLKGYDALFGYGRIDALRAIGG